MTSMRSATRRAIPIMKRFLPTRSWVLLAAGTLLLTAARPAQVPRMTDGAQDELKELFGKVERHLREIDRMLSDAGAGDVSKLKGVPKGGIEELLRTSHERQRQVIDDIDKILELASQIPQSSGGGSQSEPRGSSKDQGSPLDKQGEQRTERESTPSAPEPGDKQNGEKPQAQSKGSKPDQKDEPRDPRASKDPDPHNVPSGKNPGQPTEAPARAASDKDRWGDLPVHARDVFRTEGGGDMPLQYRDWIDAYYRRLNRKP